MSNPPKSTWRKLIFKPQTPGNFWIVYVQHVFIPLMEGCDIWNCPVVKVASQLGFGIKGWTGGGPGFGGIIDGGGAQGCCWNIRENPRPDKCSSDTKRISSSPFRKLNNPKKTATKNKAISVNLEASHLGLKCGPNHFWWRWLLRGQIVVGLGYLAGCSGRHTLTRATFQSNLTITCHNHCLPQTSIIKPVIIGHVSVLKPMTGLGHSRCSGNRQIRRAYFWNIRLGPISSFPFKPFPSWWPGQTS